jgi:hypothetical protein
MNYYDIPFDECIHRYACTPAPDPTPPAAPPPVNPNFMWNTIMGRLLRTLDAFPEARAASVETLRILKDEYANAT